MVESYEIRLFRRHFSLLVDHISKLPDSSGLAVCLRGRVGDPLFVRIGELDEQLRKSGEGPSFAGWTIRRTYNKRELTGARLFLLSVPFTHVAAEEFGTEYWDFGDCGYESESLEHFEGTNFQLVRGKHPCGLWSRQAGPLRIPYSRLRKGHDIFRIWGGELIVSKRLRHLIDDTGFSKCSFSSVVEVIDLSRRSPRPTQAMRNSVVDLYQLKLESNPLEISEITRFGSTPFDNESTGHHKCEAGEIAGYARISPVTVLRSSWDGSDLCRTRVFVGGRRGLFRPHPLFIVSAGFLRVLQQSLIRGFNFEIVELI